MRTTPHSGEVIVSIIQAESLEAKGLLHDQSSSLQIQGKRFRPGPAFTKLLRHIAIEFCEDARSHGRQYILIEFPTYLMAWLRVQTRKSTQSSSSANAEAISLKSPTLKDASAPQHQLEKIKTGEPTTPSLSEKHKPQKRDSSSVNSAFIDQCKAELANHIGPMAHLITQQILDQSPQLTCQQLVEALVVHIPDVNTAHAFREAIQLPFENKGG